MTIDDILTEGRRTWGDKPMTLAHIAAAVNVVSGDIARHARGQFEGKESDPAALKTELGNLISSVVRWCDDLGFDPAACVQLSQQAQAEYATKHPPKW